MALPGQIDMAAASPLAQSGYELVATESGEAGPSQWQVVGDESQLLAVLLNPGQSVMSEPGAMLSTSDYIQPELDMGGVGLACQRACCAQESCFRVHYKNVTGAAQHVTFSPAFPAKVVALNMDKHPHGFFLSKRSWMAGIGSDQEFGVECNPSCLTMCCACQGLMLTTFKGSGDAFLNAGGTVLQRTLGAGEKIIVDTFSLLAWEKTVAIDVKAVGSCGMQFCGSQGFFNTELTGPGLVMVHTMSLDRARAAYMQGA